MRIDRETDETLEAISSPTPWTASRCRGREAGPETSAPLPCFTTDDLDAVEPLADEDWRELKNNIKPEPSEFLQRRIAARVLAARKIKYGV